MNNKRFERRLLVSLLIKAVRDTTRKGCSRAMMKVSLIFVALIVPAGYSSIALAYNCTNTTLDANDGCVQGSTFLDSPLNVNGDSPFGNNDWVLLDTSADNGVDDAEPGYVFKAAAGMSGDWKITFSGQNPWDSYQDLMVTLQVSTTNSYYVAYSLVPMDLSGTYTVGGTVDLGHARLWGKPNNVPIPGAVWLFCSGLLGLIGIARRNKAS